MNRVTVRGLIAALATLFFSASASAGMLAPFQLKVGNTTRHLLLYTPDGELAKPKGNAPLVLVFHGNRQSAQQMANSNSGLVWRQLADGKLPQIAAGGFYVAFLNGAAAGSLSSSANTSATWNDCDSTRYNNVSTADDVRFVRELVAAFTVPANVVNTPTGVKPVLDATRIYAYGFSNGAGMALRLGREAGDVVAAISVIANTDPASNNDECLETQIDGVPARRPALFIHGTADALVSYSNSCASTTSGLLTTLGIGGVGGSCRIGHVETVNAWRQSSGGNFAFPDGLAAPRQAYPKSAQTARPASATPDSTLIECVRHVRAIKFDGIVPVLDVAGQPVPATPADVRVEACTVIAGGHTEPSILTYIGALGETTFGKQNNDAESVGLAWAFFDRHRR